MKNFFFILLLNLSTLAIYAQDSSQTTFSIKDYSLRDYIAPDIQYRRLDLGTEFRGNGSEQGKTTGNSFKGNANLNLETYSNLRKYIGTSSTSLSSSFDAASSKEDTNTNKNSSPELDLYHRSSHLLYNPKNYFLSLSPTFEGKLSQYNRDINFPQFNQNTRTTEISTLVSLGVGVGTGRIQPVTAARKAMDILISLEQYQRLSKNPSPEQMDTLAYLANEISYKRFFDKRFKRVYQLAELDSVINALGLVENRDMIYAANLSDIWNYGTNYFRGSGSRFEVGFKPSYGYDNSDQKQNETQDTKRTNKYAFNTFAQWTKQVPMHYNWQSNISISTGYDMRYNSYLHQTENAGDYIESTRSTELRSQYLSSRWSLGYYPNTRSLFRLNSYINFSATQFDIQDENNEEIVEDLFGMRVGIYFDSYYYVSPRFRLELYAGTRFTSNEYNYFYRNGIPQPNADNVFTYNSTLKLAYALF